jgi:hypothetical protein
LCSLKQKLGERLSADDLVRKFEGRPYGWSPWATLTFIARLYRLGKLELREKELLSSVEVIEALTNSRRLGGVSVRKQEQFDTSTVNALKRFHQELFNGQSPGTDARSTCEAFRMAMAEEAHESLAAPQAVKLQADLWREGFRGRVAQIREQVALIHENLDKLEK